MDDLGDPPRHQTVAFRTVMQPAGLDEVSALLIREERSRSGMVLEIRKQVDDVEPKICGERKDAVVISRIRLADRCG
jgi:hypothetical protein